ncbi:MAG: hypothetical protein AAF611_03590 [Bacteroidota bacterium]
MRVLKVVLIVCLVSLLGFLIAIFLGSSYEAADPKSKQLFAGMLISIGLGIFLGIMALLYHVQSFRYYRQSKRMQKIKKIPAFFIVCAILSHIYFLLISVAILVSAIFEIIQVRSDMIGTYFLVVATLVYAIVSIIEVSVLKKQIRMYEADVFLRDEIDTIGFTESG